MSLTLPVVDGLWRCLCPATDALTFRHLSFSVASRNTTHIFLDATRSRPRNATDLRGRSYLYSRCYSTKVVKSDDLTLNIPLQDFSTRITSATTEPLLLKNYAERKANQPPVHTANTVTSSTPVVADTVSNDVYTQQIYDKLRRHSARGEVEKVYSQVSHLIKYAREKPNKRLYQALIRVNVSHDTGSASRVMSLLKQMDEAGVPLDVEICQDVLAVLAIHPNYLLRIEMLAFLRERWHSLSTSDAHHVIASMLRDNQFELALDWIDKRFSDGQEVLPWILAKAVHMLCQAHEVDEALRIARLWEAKTNFKASPFAWYHILDVASRNFNKHRAIVYIWKSQVITRYLNPSSGICLNVLATAARYGDPDLATEVFEVLGKRSTIFNLEHYELLLDAYVRAKDIKSAMTVLCIMHKSGCGLEDESTRNLYDFFREKASRVLRAREILSNLHDEGEDIPLAALNCLIRALVETGDLSTGISVYKSIHELCSSKPSTQTFDILLRGCRDPVRMDLAMFLVAEMRALEVAPGQLTFDRLVLICTSAGALDDACKYYRELCMENFTLRSGTIRRFLWCLGAAGDARAWDIVSKLEGTLQSDMRAIIEKAWRNARKEDKANEEEGGKFVGLSGDAALEIAGFA